MQTRVTATALVVAILAAVAVAIAVPQTSPTTCKIGESASISLDVSSQVLSVVTQGNTTWSVPCDELLTLKSAKWNIFSSSGNQRVERALTTLMLGHRCVSLAAQPNSGCQVTGAFGDTNAVTELTFAPSPVASVPSFQAAIRNFTGVPTGQTPIIELAVPVPLNEPIYGMGEQYNALDVNGLLNVIFTREQGVGRGLQPLTTIMDLNDWMGGNNETNYAARPIMMWPSGNVLISETSYYTEVDARIRGKVVIRANTTAISGLWGATSSLRDSVAVVNARYGPQAAPPAWSYQGVIVGMQGGSEAVLGNFSKLTDLGAPMGAFWLQDWTGPRQLTGRTGLWWNWGWNPSHYPNYTGMMATLNASGVQTLVYANPMLVDAAKSGSPVNFWAEGANDGYFVRHGPKREYWVGYNGASLVDLTNPAAFSWFKGIIKGLFASGARGMMADFGEALPLDAELNDTSVDAAAYHNAYPDDWFRLCREAAEELGISDDVFFFGRSAWLYSGRYYTGAWQGDQLCNWDDDDGIGTAVTSLLSSGMSGTPFTHSDVGGYNAIEAFGIGYHRTEELFYRWCELASFTSFFRTHDGSSPHGNFQFYRTEKAYTMFARYAKMFGSLGFYRKLLMTEAINTSMPVVRAMVLETDDWQRFGNVKNQYFFGSEFVVAPVITKGAVTRTLMVPKGCWELIWDRSQRFTSGGEATVPAPIGCPPVLGRCNSPIVGQFVANLQAANVTSMCQMPSK